MFDAVLPICYPTRMMIAAELPLALSLLVAAVLSPVELKAQSRPRIVVGHASMSSVVLTLWAAQDKGFFAKNNIDAQLVFIPGSPTLIASLNTGDVHFGFTGGTATLGAALAGLAELNLEKLIDESFLREFERSGFLDQQFGVKSGIK